MMDRTVLFLVDATACTDGLDNDFMTAKSIRLLGILCLIVLSYAGCQRGVRMFDFGTEDTGAQGVPIGTGGSGTSSSIDPAAAGNQENVGGGADSDGQSGSGDTPVVPGNVAGSCEATEVLCQDGKDDDCDGDIDCSDADCAGQLACGGGQFVLVAPPICEARETFCQDGNDNDCDGHVDCADSNCASDPVCMGGNVNVLACSPEDPDLIINFCTNGRDDDCDGLIDCNDNTRDPLFPGQPACSETCFCPQPGTTEICCNALDDDGDGKIDCADPDCAGMCPALP